MISKVITLLNAGEFYNSSEEIEVAKGRHYLPRTFSKTLYLIKRRLKWRKKS